MLRRWSFLPLRNADAGGGSGGGASDAGTAAGAADAGAAADAGSGAAPAGDAAPPARPDFVPENLWDAATGKPTVDLAALATLKTQHDERAAQIPADAAGYKVEMPEGSTWKPDDADPLLGAAREWAKAEGLTQGQFNGVLALRAKMEKDAADAADAAAAVELTKLGDKASTRIDTVTQFLSAKLTKAQFDAIRGAVQTADGVAAIETIMQMVGGPQLPGTAPPSAKPRDAADILYGTNR